MSLKKEYKKYGLNNLKECELYLEELMKEKDKNNEIINRLSELINITKQYNIYKQLLKKINTSNLRLVVPIAKRYFSKEIDIMELIQEGNFGLQKAIEKFDLDKNCKFSTYATYWIRQSIQRFVAENRKAIRVPVNIFELKTKINSIESYLEKKLLRKASNEEILEEIYLRAKNKLIEMGNENPSVEEIKKIAKMDEYRLRKIQENNLEIVSLYNLIGEEQDTYLIDLIEDESQLSVEEQVFNNIKVDEVKLMLEKLKPREKLIIVLRFGLSLKTYFTLEEFNKIVKENSEKCLLNSDEIISDNVINLYQELSKKFREKTLEEVGNIFGLTRERVRQIEARALRRIRNQEAAAKKILKNNIKNHY